MNEEIGLHLQVKPSTGVLQLLGIGEFQLVYGHVPGHHVQVSKVYWYKTEVHNLFGPRAAVYYF